MMQNTGQETAVRKRPQKRIGTRASALFMPPYTMRLGLRFITPELVNFGYYLFPQMTVEAQIVATPTLQIKEEQLLAEATSIPWPDGPQPMWRINRGFSLQWSLHVVAQLYGKASNPNGKIAYSPWFMRSVLCIYGCAYTLFGHFEITEDTASLESPQFNRV